MPVIKVLVIVVATAIIPYSVQYIGVLTFFSIKNVSASFRIVLHLWLAEARKLEDTKNTNTVIAVEPFIRSHGRPIVPRATNNSVQSTGTVYVMRVAMRVKRKKPRTV